MSHFPRPPSPNEIYKEQHDRLMAKQQEERKQLWRDSMVAFVQSGDTVTVKESAELADAIVAEYDKRFKNV